MRHRTFVAGFGLAGVAVAARRFAVSRILAWRAGLGVLTCRPAFAAGRVMLDDGSGGERRGRSDEQRSGDHSGHGEQHKETFRVWVGLVGARQRAAGHRREGGWGIRVPLSPRMPTAMLMTSALLAGRSSAALSVRQISLPRCRDVSD